MISVINEQQKYMSMAIELSLRGLGNTSPNPIVGCVVVKDGVVVGTGYHEYAGGPHAEVIALKQAGERAKGADLYVTLEPCNHYGRTPPCTDAIIESGVKRVFIAVRDPNPQVDGSGINVLKNADIETYVGVMEKKAAFENRFYLTFRKSGRPYVTLKVAATLDGKIADRNKNSKWITSEKARNYVQSLRKIHDAVLVGAGTVRVDDPLLTYRGNDKKIPPLKRVVVVGGSGIPTEAKIFENTDISPLILVLPEGKDFPSFNREKKNVQIVHTKRKGGRVELKALLQELAEMEIVSLLVEGGSDVFSQFLEDNLYDEVYWFIAPKLLGNGLEAVKFKNAPLLKSAPDLKLYSIETLSNDIMIRLFNPEASWC